jgi:membrane-bound serine protease (ClpP class)
VLLIIAIVLLLVLPSPWGFIAFAACLVLFVLELLFWNRTVKNRRHAVGAETMLGRTASVVRACEPDGQVKIDGEIWEAHAATSAAVGDTVRIVGRDKLVLLVERVDGRPS